MRRLSKYDQLINSVSDVDAARLAAFIDGEGTIYINRQARKNPSYSARHYLCVVVTNTSPLLMDWLKATFSGSVFYVSRKNSIAKNPRQVMRWQLNERQAEAVLRRCLPFFVIKKQHAEVGLAFRQLKGIGRRGRWLTDSNLAMREDFRLQIQRLNQAGAPTIQ